LWIKNFHFLLKTLYIPGIFGKTYNTPNPKKKENFNQAATQNITNNYQQTSNPPRPSETREDNLAEGMQNDCNFSTKSAPSNSHKP
jgi:hypothetical protein